MFKEDKFKKKN